MDGNAREIAQVLLIFQNEEAMERAATLSRGSIACVRKRNLEEIIATASENNVHLRKKLDLIKYHREKVGKPDIFASRRRTREMCECTSLFY